MPNSRSEPAGADAGTGRITRISVTYTLKTCHGQRHTFHSLASMRKKIQPERLAGLLAELSAICEELQASR